jgi:hypothetical protein
MWSKEVTYAKQNGGNFTWIIQANEAIPVEQAFWYGARFWTEMGTQGWH